MHGLVDRPVVVRSHHGNVPGFRSRMHTNLEVKPGDVSKMSPDDPRPHDLTPSPED